MHTCKQCEVKYEISEKEIDFFNRIGPKFGSTSIEMPLPTLCPDCRNHRRQLFRNDRVFYKRNCDMSGESFISLYPENSDYKVYRPSEWYSDKWNPMDNGREFDFSRPFFEQFSELMHDVPRLGIDIVNCENSEYCNYCGDDKNCYLDIAGEANEDCYYNLFVKQSRDVCDCTFVYSSELCYESINSYDCYGCQHCIYCDNCTDCLYCFDLIGCKNCIFSHGLRNKEYCVFNKQYTKADYEKYIESLHLESFDQREKLYEGWVKFKLEHAVFRANYLLSCENCTGNNLKNCKNCDFSFNATNSEDCRYLYDVLDAKDCQDLNYSLYKPELSYELISTLSMVNSAFSMASHYNNEVYYCDLTNNSSHLFGCIGLKHGEYCILNKQYTKEEYEEVVPKIIEHMKQTGEWGEFFPISISPFAYNETVAQEYFPLTKEEVVAKGWRWVDREASDKGFRIIPQEEKLYRRLNIPDPQRSPDQRHLDRIKLRTPRKLWERECCKCGAGVKTPYSPER